jgi:hypothetical protein
VHQLGQIPQAQALVLQLGFEPVRVNNVNQFDDSTRASLDFHS